MSWLSNVKIGRRLGGAFGVVVLLTLAVGIIALVALHSVSGTYRELIDTRAANRANALGLQTATAREAAAFRGYALTGKPAFIEAFTAAGEDFASGLEALRARDDGSAAAQLDTIGQTHEAYLGSVAQARAALERGDREGASRIIADRVTPANDEAQAALDPFVERESAEMASGTRRASDATGTAQLLAIVVLGLAVAIAAVLALLITRSIVRPLRRIEDATRGAAEGNLTVRADVAGRDELGQVAGAFDRMMEAMRDVIGRVAEAARAQSRTAGEMASASEQSGQAVGQIAATVEQVARGSAEQAEATQGATQTVVEMAQGVAQVAEGGQAAARAADDAERAADGGAETVAQATEAMSRIGESVSGVATMVDALGERARPLARSSPRSRTSPRRPTCWR
jgi:methyl-accepting chemotaxis protein